MRVLITGIGGFVGQHLARHLCEVAPNYEIHGTIHRSRHLETSHLHYHTVDLRDINATQALIHAIQPHFIYHLAAQAFVPRSFIAPWETLENNIRSQLNITLACLELTYQPRLLVVGSAEVYGIVKPEEVPMTENLHLKPTSPYSVSKVAQEMLALQYHLSHNLQVMRARPFNHFGPGQNERFVAPAFAMQVARIEAQEQSPIISVGDLTAQRDFTDVRDIVAAYQLIIEQGQPGDVYNVASNEAHSISDLLSTLIQLINLPIEVHIDENRLRPVEIPILRGDASHLRASTGWQPHYSFEHSLADVLDDCRFRVSKERINK